MHFLKVSDYEYLFVCLLAICLLRGKISIQVHHPFLIGLFNLFSFGLCLFLISEKAMATRSSTLAWKIPWAEEPDRLQSMGSLRVGHD